MTFRLTIDMDTSAFVGGGTHELSRILEATAKAVWSAYEGDVVDRDGAPVGRWTVERVATPEDAYDLGDAIDGAELRGRDR